MNRTISKNDTTEHLVRLLLEKEAELKLKTAQIEFLLRRNYEILAEIDAAEQSTL